MFHKRIFRITTKAVSCGIVCLWLSLVQCTTIITNENGEMLEGVIGPFNEGTHLSLICEIEGDNPKSQLTWWRSSTLMDDTYMITSQGVVKNEIAIPRLKRHDLLVELTCKTTSNLTDPTYISVKIDLNLRPLHVKITSTQSPVRGGYQGQLTCVSTGSRPPAQLSWWRDGKKLHNASESISQDGNSTISVINITHYLNDQGERVICRAENPSLPNSALQDEWTLYLYLPPPPGNILIFNEHGQEMHGVIGPFDEGSDLTLFCLKEDASPSESVSWWRGSTMIDNTSIFTPEGEVKNYITLRLRRSDLMAELKCRHSKGAEIITLDLKLKPLDVRITSPQNPVWAGTQVHLTCESAGSRPPSQLSWWKGRHKLNDAKQTIVHDRNITKSVLSFWPSIEDNDTQLTCRAKNPAFPEYVLQDKWTLNVQSNTANQFFCVWEVLATTLLVSILVAVGNTGSLISVA